MSAVAPVVELELSSLDLRYRGLRISDPQGVARLAAAVGLEGQVAPVLAIQPATTPILIDGFVRVAALRRLRRDTVPALLLGLTEQEALSFSYRQHQGRRPTALEEGWLVQELHLQHRQSLGAVAAGLERSTSWASRRLGLVRELPEAIQELVRRGAISAHGAMRSLLPLARANADAAVRLGSVAREEKLTTRQLGRLCAAWRAGDGAQRAQLLAQPRLYLRLDEHVSTKSRQPEQPALVRDFETMQAIARRACRILCDVDRREPAGATEALLVVWPRTCGAFRDLTQIVEQQTQCCPTTPA
jgi:ParB-like chromosome segregation protein Spo0J